MIEEALPAIGMSSEFLRAKNSDTSVRERLRPERRRLAAEFTHAPRVATLGGEASVIASARNRSRMLSNNFGDNMP